jgi:hypothetical protein
MAQTAASALNRAYDEISRAVAGRDARKLMALYAPNAEFIDIFSRHVTAAGSRKHRDVCSESSPSRGNEATVRTEGVYRLDSLNNNQWTSIIAHLTSEDVWERNNGAWKLARSHILNQHQTIDPEFLAAMLTGATTAQAVASELKERARPLAGGHVLWRLGQPRTVRASAAARHRRVVFGVERHPCIRLVRLLSCR